MITLNTPSTTSSSSVVGFKPNRLIAESEKTEQWAKEMLDWCIAHADLSKADKVSSLFNMFNGERDNEQLDYITKSFGIDYPTKIKYIPLIRPKLNTLIGEEQERGIDFELISTDSDSIDERKDHVYQYVLKRFIQLQRQEITEEEFEKEEQFLKRSFKTNKEIAIYHMVKEYIFKHRIHETFSDCMINKLVTGMEYGRVNLNRMGEDPVFETVPAYQFYYAPNNVKWVSDSDWGLQIKSMSSTEIMDSFGEYMEPEQRNKLFERREIYGKESIKLGGGQTMDSIQNAPIGFQEHSAWQNDLFDVYEVEFKSIRKIPVHVSPNKKNADVPFRKVLNEEQYQSLPNNRKKKVKFYYIEDLWRGVRIGPDVHVRLGRVNFPERSQTKPSKVKLSFEGLTFTGPTNPYSLVKVTWDIQMLYDIMHFHKENLIAMSGTKGAIMDIAQMPDFGYGADSEEGFMKNLQMFLYYKKMGSMFIDSSKDRMSSFNQFGNYDDTVGSGLSVVLEVIRHLEEVAGEIVNINRQRIGNIGSRDGKGNTDTAISQSSLGTEPIFNEHDDFKDRILTKVVNLSRVSFKDGKSGTYVDKNFDQHMYTVEPEFTMGDFNIFITNRAGTKATVEGLKVAAQNYAQQGLIPFEYVIDILTTGSLKEIQTILKEQIKESQEKIQERQQQQAEVENQLAQAKNQADQAKFAAEIEKIKSDIELKQQELALKQTEVMSEIDYKNKQLVLEQKRIDLEALQLQLSDNAKEIRND